MESGSSVCAKRIVVDVRHHMLDRLSSIIVKELLNDQKVIIVRYKEIGISAGLARQGVTWQTVRHDGHEVIRDLTLVPWETGRTART
jgi:ribosomal protein L13